MRKGKDLKPDPEPDPDQYLRQMDGDLDPGGPKTSGSPTLCLVTLVMLSCFKAVRCDAVPSLKIPTDEHLKLFGKKQPRPPKALVVARTEASRRFKEHTS